MKLRVAFSHDWLNGMRGGEKCLEGLCELFPDSPIYTLFYEKGRVSGPIAAHPIISSWLERLPKIYRHYRQYLPLFPKAVETFRLENYDLVLSTSHCVAKGIRKNKGALHVCYCFTPMRYAWALFDEYFSRRNALSRVAIRGFMNSLKAWDLKSNEHVDHFVAISHHVRNRIRDYYGRDAEVIYPPVDTDFFTPGTDETKENFYLVVSAFAPYKRIDLAIEAFNRLGRRLVVIGDGPEKKRLARAAKRNIEFVGWQSDESIRDFYRQARALVFPGEEDFGIVPVEAQACGSFVIAYGRGGALETVEAGRTGIFFAEATPESLEEAVLRFEKMSLSPAEARGNALRFHRERFKLEMNQMIQSRMGRVTA